MVLAIIIIPSNHEHLLFALWKNTAKNIVAFRHQFWIKKGFSKCIVYMASLFSRFRVWSLLSFQKFPMRTRRCKVVRNFPRIKFRLIFCLVKCNNLLFDLSNSGQNQLRQIIVVGYTCMQKLATYRPVANMSCMIRTADSKYALEFAPR